MKEALENRVELLTLLNKAVARELQVSIQYMLQHTLLTSGKEFLGTSLKKIAVTEMRHAEAVAERIVAWEEKPTTQPDPVVIGDSPTEMIEIDQEAEEGAIRLYTQIIDMAKKQGDEITVKLFQ